MKKYLIPIITVLVVLAVTLAAFGQAEERAKRREEMRQRFQNMSEEERAQFRAQRGGFGRGGFINPEAQEKAIKTIEEQLAKLKAAQITRPEGGFQDLSEEERTKLRENMQNRQQALQTIIAQVAMLQGRVQPAAGGGQFLLINTEDLKPIQEAAVKEKAEETTQLLQSLITRSGGRGLGGRGQGTGQRSQDQGDQDQRAGREQRTQGQGGQGGGRQRNR